ncbi:tyrosine-type recombinase/integrase [Humibacter sp.]|uniref:tyrosine-type recombinase/integrase n=1 Tax=Humibacter sp. TaxID=1940291 RepID=UPI003F7D1534
MARAADGTVRKLASGRWQARLTFPDGVRRPAPTTFQTKRDATAWLRQQEADVSRGVWQAQQHAASMAVTFEDYAARWMKNRRVKGRALKPKTLETYQDLLDKFLLPTFGSKSMHSIERDDVERWYDRTAVDTPTYRAKAYSLLRTILAGAVEDGHLPMNPARIRGAGSVERAHDVQPASIEELDALTEAMPPRYRMLVLLAAWCGLRFGELTELRRKDIDTKRGIVHVRRGVTLVGGKFVVSTPKTAAGIRDVAVPPFLLPQLREHLLRFTAPGSSGLLFPAKNDPEQHMRQSALTRVFYPARETAGRPDLRFHDLRHTGAVNAAIAGATLAELMGRLGHSTASAAMRYQHIAADRDAEVAKRLSALYEAHHTKQA